MANNSAYQCDPNLKLNVRNMAVDAALCPSYENAGCRLSIDALVCDRCSDFSLTSLTSVPAALPAGVTRVVIRCHDIEFISFTEAGYLYGVTHLDLSDNIMINGMEPSSIALLPNLQELNLSGNRLSNITALPVSASLRVLDLRRNPIQTINSHLLAGLFDPSCDYTPTLLMDEDQCQCQLYHRVNGFCNTVDCDCADGRYRAARLPCGPIEADACNQSIALSQLCDGVTDCMNQWDENMCQKGTFDTTETTLGGCVAPTMAVRFHRGIALVQPLDRDFVSGFCPFYNVQIRFTALYDTAVTTSQIWRSPTPDEGIDVRIFLSISPIANNLFALNFSAAFESTISDGTDPIVIFVVVAFADRSTDCTISERVDRPTTPILAVSLTLGGVIALCAVALLLFHQRASQRVVLSQSVAASIAQQLQATGRTAMLLDEWVSCKCLAICHSK